MERESVYVRLYHRIEANPKQMITVGDIAAIANKESHSTLTKIPLYSIPSSKQGVVIIDIIQVIKKMYEVSPNLDIQTIGPSETIVMVNQKKPRLNGVYFILVWFLLFIGAGLAIMNFHEDVSMNEVHTRIFRLVTGNEVAKPLLLQIPYSIGLGVGMILFFNHFFKKRLSDEPSPLEVEMFNYQQDLDQYVIRHHDKNKSEHHAD